VPQNLCEEEKIIGGVFTLRQAGYISVGVVFGLLLAYFVPGRLHFKASAFSVPLVMAVIFSMGRYKEIALDRLLIMYIAYMRGRKHFAYEREGKKAPPAR
jgi:hypothetical protein